MASRPGGPAEKTGGEYESLWLAKLLIDVLQERALWLAPEPADADRYKAECFVGFLDGRIEAHQCKVEKDSRGNWTAADLQSRRVLHGAVDWLNQAPNHHYVFVSSHHAIGLSDLHNRAVKTESLEDFWQDARANDTNRKDIKVLAEALGVDSTTEAGQSLVRDFMRRFSVKEPHRSELRQQLEDQVEALVVGDPAACVRLLEGLAASTSQRRIHRDDVVQKLRAEGFTLSDLAHDKLLGPSIDEHNNRFRETVSATLLGGRLLKREVTKAVLAAGRDPSARLVMVHGSAGSGKTGVLFEIIEELQADGEPFLVLSLERDRPALTERRNPSCPAHLSQPVAALDALSAGRRAWLILDQFDSLRWSARHDPNALEDVIDIIRRAEAHPLIRVVVSCRSVDAQSDDRIRTLMQSLERNTEAVRRIEVPPLTDAERDSVLSDMGVNPNQLTGEQRRILRLPACLWVLSRLRSDNVDSSFVSVSQLFGRLWSHFRHSHLTDSERTEFDDRFVPMLLNTATAASGVIPEVVYNRHSHLVARLQSLGVVTTADGGKFRFAHQSLFDYLVAEQMRSQLGGNPQEVVEWCLMHDDLFDGLRLQLFLELLGSDDPDQLAQLVEVLLDAPSVRFHLKSKALSVLASMRGISAATKRLLLSRLETPEWKPHFTDRVVTNPDWLRTLQADGVMLRWLRGDDYHDREIAYHLLRRQAVASGPDVLRFFASLPPQEAQELRTTAYRYIEFAALHGAIRRDFLAWSSRTPEALFYFDFAKLASSASRHAIEAFECILSNALTVLEQPADEVQRQQSLEGQLDEAIKHIAPIARRFPLRTLRACQRALNRIRRYRVARGDEQRAQDRGSYRRRKRWGLVRRLVIVAGVAAGRKACTFRPLESKRFIRRVLVRRREGLHTLIVARSMLALPTDAADWVIGQLIARPRLLSCGIRSRRSPHYARATLPARSLIGRFGVHASPRVTAQLERAIRSHVPTWEREQWVATHQQHMGQGWRKNGGPFAWLYARTMFITQYLLLDAMPRERLSIEALDWLGVLCRKFGTTGSLLGATREAGGGLISPSIDLNVAKRFSDRTWMRLIGSKKLSQPNYSHRHWRSLKESSHDQFSRLFRACVSASPGRFAEFALDLPADTRAEYVEALFSGLSHRLSDDGSSTARVTAQTERIERLVEHFRTRLDDRSIAQAVCWLIQARPQEAWSARTIDLIEELTRSHMDPSPGVTPASSGAGDSARPDHVTSAINCVRGVACHTWAALHRARPDLLDRTVRILEALVEDPHPAVRVAAIELCLVTLTDRREASISAFIRLAADPQLATPEHSFERMLSWALDDPRVLRIVEGLCESADAEIQTLGAKWRAAVFLRGIGDRDAVDRLVAGSPSQRLGVAEVAADLARDASINDEWWAWLLRLLNDTDADVRSRAGNFVHSEPFLQRADAPQRLLEWVDTKAFEEDCHDLLSSLEGFRHPLAQFSTVLSEITMQVEKRRYSESRTLGMVALSLSKVLLRLYGELDAHDPARNVCLDAFDHALRSRVADLATDDLLDPHN
jgi:hypothetical protein